MKKAEDLVRASREQQDNVFRVFEYMHLDLRRIARERAALMRTLSPLESSNIQFRIQACAFDENIRVQFFALADAIWGMVHDVKTAVGQRFEELERTGEAAGELVARLGTLATRQKCQTEKMLADSRNHLSNLNQALRSSEAAAESMSQSGAKIAGGVSKAIVALQCQDMARQKFQHITAAIDDMARQPESDGAGGRQFLREASRLQLGHLRTVFAQLDNAARQLEQGLREIESETRRFAENAHHSGGATLDCRIIGQAIESIHAVLGLIENAVGNITEVLELVHKLKATFRDCTYQILGLALRLRMVALNAQIFAAHVDAGAALEVVAGHTRTIADEAMQQLDDISARVTALVDSVVDLQHRLGDYAELAAMEQSLLSGEAGDSETKLRAVEDELRKALTAIAPLEAELSGIIRSATAAIRFPAAVAAASTRSTVLFQEIADEYADATGGPAEEPHQKLQALKSNYTMEHERAVHDAVIGAFPPPAGENAEAPEEEKLADNVELF